MSAILISVSILLLAGLALLYYFLRKRGDSLPIRVEEPAPLIEAPKEPEPEPSPLIEPLDLEKEINDLISRSDDVKALFAKLDCPVESQQVQEKQSRIEALRDLIACIVTAEYRRRLIMNQQSVPDYIDSASSKNHLQSKAKLYLDATWLHTPSLAAMIAVVLLDCELVGSQSSEQIEIDLKPLRLIRDEIASRVFDTTEVVRRLRQIEEHRCYFSSLVYPILTEGQFGSVEEDIEEEPVPESVEEPVAEEPETTWNLTAEVSALINATPQLAEMRERLERRLWENPSLAERHTAKAEMEEFYRLLEEALTFRHQFDLLSQENVIQQASLQILKKQLQHEAKRYLNIPSLHTSWLSHYVSASLLYAELATLPDQFQQTLGQALRTIADDYALNNCEAIESVERLRNLEQHGLYVSSLIYTFLAPAENPEPDSSIDQIPSALDVKQSVQQLIETNSELSDLYKKLGYSAELDRSSAQLLKEMKELIRTEIPDFDAFKSALKAAQDQADKQLLAETGALSNPRIKYQAENNALLSAVLAAAGDQQQVFELLNKDPINEQLPFIEQLPVSKNGVTVWRTPLEHSLIRKRPADPERFAVLLDQLENLFSDIRHPQNRQVHDEVLEAIARVRRDLGKETGYMPTALQALESKVADYMAHSRNAATQAKKDQLDATLEELLTLRYDFSLIVREAEVAASQKFPALRQNVQQLAKRYLDASWMFTPLLTTWLLAALLDCELAVFDKKETSTANNPAGVLKIVRDEIDKDCYDSDESIRRLQYQESQGLYINSLIYPLLRLNISAAVNRSKIAAKAGAPNG